MTKQSSKTTSTTTSTTTATVLDSTDTSRDLQALFMAQIGTEPFNEARPERPARPEGYSAVVEKLEGLVEGTARGIAGSAHSSSLTGDDINGLFLEQLDRLSRSGFEFGNIGPALEYRNKARLFSSAERTYDDRAEHALGAALKALEQHTGDVLAVLEARSIVGPDIAEAGAAPNRTMATVAVEMLLAEAKQQNPKPLALRAGRGLMLLSAAGIDMAALDHADVMRGSAGALAEHAVAEVSGKNMLYAGGTPGLALQVSGGVVYEMKEAAAGKGLRRYAVLAATTEGKLAPALAALEEEQRVNQPQWRTPGASRTLPDYRAGRDTSLVARHSGARG